MPGHISCLRLRFPVPGMDGQFRGMGKIKKRNERENVKVKEPSFRVF